MSNSNPSKGIRDTFGIIDGKTGELYPDILSYHLGQDVFYPLHLSLKDIQERGNRYLLHMDSKLRRRLRNLKEAEGQKVIISFQTRTTGRIALARIHR